MSLKKNVSTAIALAILSAGLCGCVAEVGGPLVVVRHREAVVVEPVYVRPLPPPVVYVQPPAVVVAPPVYVSPPPQPVVVMAPPPPVPQPALTVVVPAPAPVIVEEGVAVGGVVVAEPVGISDYVFIGGGWYYWHPGVHTWVHANRPNGWRPGPSIHVQVMRSWGERPDHGGPDHGPDHSHDRDTPHQGGSPRR